MTFWLVSPTYQAPYWVRKSAVALPMGVSCSAGKDSPQLSAEAGMAASLDADPHQRQTGQKQKTENLQTFAHGVPPENGFSLVCPEGNPFIPGCETRRKLL